MRRSHRLFVGAGALGALAATPVLAQHRTTGISLNYSALAAGNAAAPSTAPGGRAGTGLLSGLSLSNLSLAKPAAGADLASGDTGGGGSRPGNILFDMAPQSAFTPYIGIGFGGAAGRISDPTQLGIGNNNQSPADGARSYQGLAGFAYTIDKGTKLDFGYRFATTQRPNTPLADNLDLAGAERDRAAVISLHYDLNPLNK